MNPIWTLIGGKLLYLSVFFTEQVRDGVEMIQEWK